MSLGTPLEHNGEVPYWTEVYPLMPRSAAEVELPDSVDAAVVGGGLTGLSTGLQLARSGMSVLLLESDRLGGGASSRNAGMALTGLRLSFLELISKYGQETAKEFQRCSQQAIDYVEELVTKEQIDCDFSRCGDLLVAFKPSHFDYLQKLSEALQKTLDHKTELLSVEEMGRELASPLYHGGLVEPESAGLNPARLIAGLAELAESSGALLLEKCPLLGWERQGAEFLLKTAVGDCRARHLIAATNGYTSRVFPWLNRRVVPIIGYVIATEQLDANLAAQLIPNNRMVSDTKNFLFYFRRTPDERILFGGRTSFTPIKTEQATAKLKHDLCRVFPGLADTKIEYTWRGRVGFSFDRMPHIGQQDEIHYAMGYCGHGVIMSVYLGAQLARRICGENAATPFAQIEFPAKFFHWGKQPWFLPFAGAWFKLIDWLD